MHFFQFAAAWLFPCTVCATVAPAAPATSTAIASIEHDRSSSPAFSAGRIKVADSGPSPLAASSSSSASSLADQLGLRTSRKRSRSASPPCLGTRARSPEMQGNAVAALKGDAVGKYLRKISRRLRRGRATDEESKSGRRLRKSRSLPPPKSVADDTVREREEAVASAIAYCKETLRRGGGTSPPPPLPTLQGRLLKRHQEEGSASVVAQCKCKQSRSPPSPPPRRGGTLLEGQEAEGTTTAVSHWNESPRPSPPRSHCSLLATQKDGTACAGVRCKESSHHGHGVDEMSCVGESSAAQTATPSLGDRAAGELELRGRSFDEMEILTNFGGNEEIVSRYFVTIHPRGLG